MDQKKITGFVVAFFTLFLGIYLISAVINLSTPKDLTNDEYYYVPSGRVILQNPTLEPNLEHHPPLSKMLIGLSIKLFGDNPLGWRLLPLAFGIIGVGILFFLGRKVLDVPNRSNPHAQLWYLLPCFLILIESLYYTLMRSAMLEVFMIFFTLLFTLFLWLYLQTSRPLYLVLTGVFLGLGIAAKWNTVLLLPLLLFLFLKKRLILSDKEKTATLSVAVQFQKQTFTDWLKQVLIILGLAGIMYLVTYLPYLLRYSVLDFFNLQFRMMFRMTSTADQVSAATSPLAVFLWPFLPGNTLTYCNSNPTPPSSLSLIANPIILWTFWPLIIYQLKKAIQYKKLNRFYISITILCLYLPWLVIDRIKYFYYMGVLMPFLVLLITQTIIDFAYYQKNTDSKTSVKPSFAKWKKNKDLLDRFIILQDKIAFNLQNNRRLQKFFAAFGVFFNKPTVKIIFISLYLLLALFTFTITYPLLNGIPTPNHSRQSIIFYWPFLYKDCK